MPPQLSRTCRVASSFEKRRKMRYKMLNFFSTCSVCVRNTSLYTLRFKQLPSLGKRRKCVGVVGYHERKKRITERKQRGPWTASIDLHFVTMKTALLCYIYLASASWRSKASPPLLPIFLPPLLTVIETIEKYDSDADADADADAWSRTSLPLAGATAAWLTTSKTHYVTLDHCLLDYSCQKNRLLAKAKVASCYHS